MDRLQRARRDRIRPSPGGELKVETTICHEIRQNREPVVIDHVAEGRRFTAGIHTPAMYGFQSYISMPIVLPDGTFFGTLCAIDPRPARLNTPEILGMFRLFAELIAFHLDALERVAASEARLSNERQTSDLREQFIAVLGHDLRNPLSAIGASAELLQKAPLTEKASRMVALIRQSVSRMSALIDDVLDFARGRLGAGLALNSNADAPLTPVLEQIIAELRAAWPDRVIEEEFSIAEPVRCDRAPHRPASLEPAGQRAQIWRPRPAGTRARCHRPGLLHAVGLQPGRSDPRGRPRASLPAILPWRDPAQPAGAGIGPLHRLRGRQCS